MIAMATMAVYIILQFTYVEMSICILKQFRGQHMGMIVGLKLHNLQTLQGVVYAVASLTSLVSNFTSVIRRVPIIPMD